MANKQCNRIYRSDKAKKINYCNHIMHNFPSDEIALKDEILELKKQVIILKKTNEKNFIKFRKYEDEVKRKDREIEQLMDPRKNAEIAKVLSTKGAAILMNLKDQNNSLIQMVLNKDLQIKRLSAEIKMSKLYTATKRNGSQAQPALRLKNLLHQVQETLKQSADVSGANKEQQNTSAGFEFSSSSEESSPREINDLMLTLQSLETYIKYSNDLLAKKNQEISFLTEEIITLKKTLKCKEYKYRRQNCFFQFEDEFFNKKFPSKDGNYFRSDNNQHQNKTASVKNLFSSQSPEKEEKLPHSAPSSSSSQFSERLLKFNANGDTPLNNNHSQENYIEEKKPLYQTSNDFSSFSSTPVKTNSKNNFSTPMKTRQEKRNVIKEKWKKAWMMHKQFKKGTKESVKQNQKELKGSGTEFVEKTNEELSSDKENSQISPDIFEEINEPDEKTNLPVAQELTDFLGEEVDDEIESDREDSKSSDEKSTVSIVKLKEIALDFTDCINKSETEEFGKCVNEIEDVNLLGGKNSQNMEGDAIESKSFEEVFQQNLDSSFESDNTPVKPLRVEVQINTVCIESHEDNFIEEKSFELWTKCDANGSDYDDDDDVVVK